MTFFRDWWCTFFHGKYLEHQYDVGEIPHFKCSKCGTLWADWSGGQG